MKVIINVGNLSGFLVALLIFDILIFEVSYCFFIVVDIILSEYDSQGFFSFRFFNAPFIGWILIIFPLFSLFMIIYVNSKYINLE